MMQRRIAYLALAAVSFLVSGTDRALAAKDSGHGGSDSGIGGGLPQFDPTWFASQVFWLAAAFLILYLWFSRKTLPVLSGVLENRKEHIQSDLDTADRLTREAEQVQKAYDNSLVKAREESNRIISDVENEMKARAEHALTSFQERSAREISTAESRIEKARNDFAGQIHAVAAEAAISASEKISGVTVDREKSLEIVQTVATVKPHTGRTG